MILKEYNFTNQHYSKTWFKLNGKITGYSGSNIFQVPNSLSFSFGKRIIEGIDFGESSLYIRKFELNFEKIDTDHLPDESMVFWKRYVKFSNYTVIYFELDEYNLIDFV